MRFVLSSETFQLNGLAYPGFPILFDDDMRIVEPAHLFLVDTCIRSGRVNSRHSWERYGRDLYDFFGYVFASGLNWRSKPVIGYPHVTESYRDWALNVCKLEPSTINGRLRTIRKFYTWAHRYGLVECIPFDVIEVQATGTSGFFAHLNKGKSRSTSSVLLKEPTVPIKFLTKQQFMRCLHVIENPVHRLMFRFALQTGLRSEEFRSFPEKYIFDPSRRKDLHGQAKIRVTLHPADMQLKGNRTRDIDIPLPLMEDLWAYSVFLRQARAKQGRAQHSELFLTEEGNAYSQSAIQRVFSSIQKKAGFHVSPHMLRHTYATYTLHGLRERGFKGEALLYLRDRLGHASVSTTEIYLHLLSQIDANLMLLHEEEINTLFRTTGT